MLTVVNLINKEINKKNPEEEGAFSLGRKMFNTK